MNSCSVLPPFPSSSSYLADAVTSPPPSVRSSPKPAESWPVAILGVPFDAVSTETALSRIEAMIAARKPHYVVTANVDFLVQGYRDVELRRILIEADLVLCDGTPLLWASRWLGNALPERVAGSDLTPRMLQMAAERGYRVFFLGAGPGIAAEAAARLQRELPTLQIVGHYSPPMAPLLEMDHDGIAQRIRAAAPDIVLVSFGCPKQEKWIAMHYRSLGVPVCIGVGATLDFLAGKVKRAPEWMRRSGCEWFYRLCQEPRRLYRRYATDAVEFMPALALQRWRMATRSRKARKPAGLATADNALRVVDAGHALTRAALVEKGDYWRQLAAGAVDCVLDVSRVQQVDATGVAFLVKWRKARQQAARKLVLLAPSVALRMALQTSRLTEFFVCAADALEARRLVVTDELANVAPNDPKGAIHWRGEIIMPVVEAVWSRTAEAIRGLASRGSERVIIDLSGVRFIDSSAAGLMVKIKKWAQAQHIEVLFSGASGNVRNVLRLARLDGLLLGGQR